MRPTPRLHGYRKGPSAVQLWLAVVVPLASQPEFVPSPQLNWYCTAWPALEVEPAAV